MASGEIFLPLIGAVKVAGLTQEEAEQLITRVTRNMVCYRARHGLIHSGTGKRAILPDSLPITLAASNRAAGRHSSCEIT